MNASRPRRKTARLLPALCLLLACCAGSVRTEPPLRRVLGRQIAGLARSLTGIPYVFGGSDIDGFDCSGLVFYVYDCFGIRLPRSAREQAGMPGAVGLKRAVAGDVLVFKLKTSWHSGIYLGEGLFVHAPSRRGWVRLETLNEYWREQLRAVIAVLPGRLE